MKELKQPERLQLSEEEAARFTDSLGDERLLTRSQTAAFLNVISVSPNDPGNDAPKAALNRLGSASPISS